MEKTDADKKEKEKYNRFMEDDRSFKDRGMGLETFIEEGIRPLMKTFLKI